MSDKTKTSPIPPSVLGPWIREKTGCSDRSGLERWQLSQLRTVISLAKERSRFYREHLAEIDPGSLRTMGDLAHIPFTTSEQLRADPQSWLCCPSAQISRVVTLKTSGTTASPKRVFFTGDDQDSTVDFFACGMRELVRPGDRAAILMPCAQPGSVGDLLGRALSRIKVDWVPTGPVTDVAACYDRLRREGCTCLVGIPVQVLGLAQYGAGFPSAQRLSLRSVLLSADAAHPALVRKLESLLDCPVFNHFGMTEMGLGCAVECGAHQGCHIRENDLLLEVVDPVTGAPLPLGQEGEFVFTTLTRQAMPFIRYRTGDRGVLLPGRCACGSEVRRMLPQGGRLGQSAGGLSLWELDGLLLPCPGLVDYTARVSENTLEITAFGILPPDPEDIRAALFPCLGGRALQVETRPLTGFTGNGMGKRMLLS